MLNNFTNNKETYNKERVKKSSIRNVKGQKVEEL